MLSSGRHLLSEGNSGFKLYDFSDIKDATNNFSSESLLGKDGFGSVYKVSSDFRVALYYQ
uniref:Protein kinase domain-containing protein n=1 Tax=Oryza meridionalis TaxID=40149 RepID=A0A0E0EC91_9ORYZ